MRSVALQRGRVRAVRRLLMMAAGTALLGTGLARAVDTERPFDDPVLDARYRTVTHEVRCLVCQNQTIADSSAPLAADLRREIREQVAAGRTEQEIVDFVVARYGDFALYRPPLQPSTWALWGAPLAFILAGAVAFARILRSRVAGDENEDAE